MGISILSYSATQWWSKWELIKQVMLLFGDVPSFLTTLDTAPATTAKLLSILNDPTERSLRELQIAAVVDVGEPLVKATYSLEGDGALGFQCYDVLSTPLAMFQTAYCPNIDTVSSKLAGGLPHIEQQWWTYALGCVNQELTTFRTLFLAS